MKNVPLLLCLLLCLIPLSAYESYSEDFVPSGHIYTYLIVPEPGQKAGEGEIRLTDDQGRVLSLAYFFAYQPEPGKEVMVALLGIGPEIDPGLYNIEGSCEFSGEEAHFSRKVQVVSRSYAQQEVSLTRELTALRSQPDPRKAEESRLRQTAIRGFDPMAIHHEEAIELPVQGEVYVSTTFGARRVYHYSDGDQSRTLHSGLDWAAPIGTPLYAVGQGKVLIARDMLVTGKTLIVEHLPGVYSVFYHMDSLDCQEGDWVESGQLVGTMGETGLATGSHLHWEIRVSRTAVDPEFYLTHPLLDKEWIISKINQR